MRIFQLSWAWESARSSTPSFGWSVDKNRGREFCPLDKTRHFLRKVPSGDKDLRSLPVRHGQRPGLPAGLRSPPNARKTSSVDQKPRCLSRFRWLPDSLGQFVGHAKQFLDFVAAALCDFVGFPAVVGPYVELAIRGSRCAVRSIARDRGASRIG